MKNESIRMGRTIGQCIRCQVFTQPVQDIGVSASDGSGLITKAVIMALSVAAFFGLCLNPAGTLMITAVVIAIASAAFVVYHEWGVPSEQKRAFLGNRKKKAFSAIAVYLVYLLITEIMLVVSGTMTFEQVWRACGIQVFLLPGMLVFLYAVFQLLPGAKK